MLTSRRASAGSRWRRPGGAARRRSAWRGASASHVSRRRRVSAISARPASVRLTTTARPSVGCASLLTRPPSARQFTVRVIDGGWMRSSSASWPGVSGPRFSIHSSTENWLSGRPASPRSARMRREARPTATRSSEAREGVGHDRYPNSLPPVTTSATRTRGASAAARATRTRAAPPAVALRHARQYRHPSRGSRAAASDGDGGQSSASAAAAVRGRVARRDGGRRTTHARRVGPGGARGRGAARHRPCAALPARARARSVHPRAGVTTSARAWRRVPRLAWPESSGRAEQAGVRGGRGRGRSSRPRATARVQDVAAVEDALVRDDRAERVGVDRPVLVPLGAEQHHVGVARGLERRGGEPQVGPLGGAFSIASGSVTVTCAPCSCICAATDSAGESRTSSELGLNAAPSTATRRPTIEPSHTSRARSTTRTRRRMLTESTSCRKPSASLDAELAGARHERADVLGQAAAAEAEARR